MTTDAPAPFKCELHMHSTYSDGSVTPRGLLEHAQKIGLSVVAITDHDNAHGSREAIPLGPEFGIEVIPAIEFTGRWDDCYRPGWGGDVDILGYFVDLDDPAFRAIEEATLADIQKRIELCCARLTDAGFPVSMDEVLAKNPRYGGARQLREVLQDKGYVKDYDESIELFAKHWQHVRLSNFTIKQHIDAIRAAGGVTVLAHPSGIECGEGFLKEERIAKLVEMGIDGIEIYHRSMSEEARAHFLPIAQKYNLLISGGSDEHGWSPDLPLMGKEAVTQDMVEALRARHVDRRAELEAERKAKQAAEQAAISKARLGDRRKKSPPPAPPAPAKPRPVTHWLVVQSSEVLKLAAANNYACYGRTGVPQYASSDLPAREPDVATLDLTLTITASGGETRLRLPDLTLRNTETSGQRLVWSAFEPVRHLQVLWVWDYYRIMSHIVLRAQLPPANGRDLTLWDATVDAVRAIQPGDRLHLDVVSACGDFAQEHTIQAAAVAWTPPA